MLAMTEETFGPTLPIMKVRDEEEAIKMANDSPYGLGASVFGKDVGHAEAVARRIDAGAVCVNDALVNYSALELPMGGAKASGLGTRHGAGGIRKYCQQQAVLITPLRAQEGPAHVPLQRQDDGAADQAVPVPLRPRGARVEQGSVVGARRRAGDEVADAPAPERAAPVGGEARLRLRHPLG